MPKFKATIEMTVMIEADSKAIAMSAAREAARDGSDFTGAVIHRGKHVFASCDFVGRGKVTSLEDASAPKR
ncbi:hypothetical protein [Azospirillum sp. TSO5]|uniref:hypothetical protein n=1 Tax=Azospirillum sp. TSO5 TaxID=716760 RepID=UPI000D64B435|nr:hypothetical protein [Azospirillum sp. TSO5]